MSDLIIAATVPISVSAAYNGTCGENLVWTLDDSGVLTISGTGEMDGFTFMEDAVGSTTEGNKMAPWYKYRTAIKSIVIKNGVTSIGVFAFYECSELISVEIPDSVTSVGSCAFWGCSSLISIEIPDGVTKIESFVFIYCESLESVKLPDSATIIEDGAFKSCKKFKSIEIPGSVESIGKKAFLECYSLASVEIAEGVTSIGSNAFYNSALTSIEIPNSVTSTSIGNSAFENCTSFESVTIPKSVTSIKNRAFTYCDNLTIYGYAGSYAETFAYSEQIPFVELPDTANITLFKVDNKMVYKKTECFSTPLNNNQNLLLFNIF